MGADDKIENAAEKAAGNAKESVGDATDNDKLKAEGKKDQTKADVKQADVKQAGEKIKDAFSE